MKKSQASVRGILLAALAGAAGLGAAGSGLVSADGARFAGDSLVLPAGIERWVLAGSSLGLAYDAPSAADAAGGGGRLFHNVYIEPSAYEHYRRTGRFKDGTLLALALHPAESSAHPRKDGLYEGDRIALEIALKDGARYAGGWAYFGFGAARPGARAAPFPPPRCRACHAANAADDHVFVQFYPALRPIRARHAAGGPR